MSYDYKEHWEHSTFSARDIGRHWIETLQEHLIPGTVLDVGCGAGRFTEYFNPADYLGIDISKAALAIAADLYPDYLFKPLDIVTDEVKNAKFDNIFAWTVLQHIPPEHIEEVARKLKAWGKNIIIVDPPGGGESGAAHCFYHDYQSLFNVIKIIPLGSVSMFVCKGKA